MHVLIRSNSEPNAMSSRVVSIVVGYYIAMLSIANTVFSTAKVLQYFSKICIGIGISNIFPVLAILTFTIPIPILFGTHVWVMDICN